MSDQSSPFLHRESKQDWKNFVAWDEPRQHATYAERIIPSEYSQKLKIETYRYRWYQRNGTLGRWMQRWGDRLLGPNRPTVYGSRYSK